MVWATASIRISTDDLVVQAQVLLTRLDKVSIEIELLVVSTVTVVHVEITIAGVDVQAFVVGLCFQQLTIEVPHEASCVPTARSFDVASRILQTLATADCQLPTVVQVGSMGPMLSVVVWATTNEDIVVTRVHVQAPIVIPALQELSVPIPFPAPKL